MNNSHNSIHGLINRNWDDKGDLGKLARITNFLYNELESGYGRRYGFQEIEREINKMLFEYKTPKMPKTNKMLLE